MTSEHTKARVRDFARKWRAAVLRGDVSRTFAAHEAVGQATYPYAASADYGVLLLEAKRVLK